MLVTQCPECKTRFRVASEQLKLRHGMVRCGQCSHVFNGVNQLTYQADPPAVGTALAPAAVVDVLVTAAPAKPVTARAVAKAKRSVPQETQREERSADDPMTLIDLSAPEESSDVEEAHTLAQLSATEADDSPPGDAAEAETEAETEVEAEVEAEAEATDTEEIPVEESTLPPLEMAQAGFLRQARRARWTNVLYALLYALGLLLLLGQGAYVFRSSLAAYWPASKPALVKLCSYASCTVELLQQPEAISIEASDLQAARQQKDVYTLNVTLRNNSRFAQQFPALEVWLTNTQNRTVVRKVFQPADYLESNQTTLDEGLLARNEFTIKLHWQASDLAASGYRVYLFYP